MIKSVKVIPGCISCKNCESVCPEVFHVNPTSQVISDKFNVNAIKVLQAELMCPVQVIKVEKEWGFALQNKKATLVSKTYLTPDTLELVFTAQDFSFIPGQYVSLQMSDIRGNFSRSYSIASGNEQGFTLTVKLLEKWRGSSYLRSLWEKSMLSFIQKPSMEVEYLGALGDFVLQDTPKRKVFIATGTGLAPMISMLEALPEDIEKLVIFGGRYEKDLYYLDKLQSFANTEVITCVSRPWENYTGETGRVTAHLNKIHADDEVYICGNPDMVTSVCSGLKEQWHREENIFHENFTLATKPEPLWKIFLFEGKIPGIQLLQNILIYIGMIAIPILWGLATYFQFTWYEIAWKSLYNHYFDLSWYTVVFVMLIRPLADVFPKIGLFRRLVVLRKWFGIVSASCVVSILIAKWIVNPFTFWALFSITAWYTWYPLLARMSEISALILLMTSNNFSQKLLGVWWKRVQYLSYVYFISGRILAGRWLWDDFIYEWIIIVFIFWTLARCKVKLWK